MILIKIIFWEARTLFRNGGNSYDLADALRKFVGAAFAGTRAEAVDYLPYAAMD